MMKESRFVKVGMILLLILLTVDIGSRIILSPLEAKAAGKQYKNEKKERFGSYAQTEQFANEIANQGWELHSIVVAGMGGGAAIFQK